MLIIGSHALRANGIAPLRPIKDTDIICSPEEYEEFVRAAGNRLVTAYESKNKKGFVVHLYGEKPFEFEIAKDGNTAAQLLDLMENKHLFIEKDGRRYASPEVLYALKLSHRYLKNNPHFRKTMDDIQYLRSLGIGEVSPVLKDWYRARMKETYWYKHPNLNVDRGDFFKDDNVNYVYDHDTLHEAVKGLDRPAYEYIKKDAAEVFCSKEKFMEAPEHIKLATVLEESYVLALERHQIPNSFEPEPEKSFLIALEKVCTSIASGWWREFAWENYHAVRALYSDEYVQKFHDGLEKGVVKPMKVEGEA